MPVAKQLSFNQQLHKFKKNLSTKKGNTPPRVILLVLANTHDKTLSKACKKDAAAIQNAFKKISSHFKFDFYSIEISGTAYSWSNVNKAIACIPMPPQANDTVIFYYTGHGFSYQNDRYNKYPQLDIRPHNKQVTFNSIDFIKDHTVNIENIVNILRLRGATLNIAIADCCNTTIPYNRPKVDVIDMWASGKMLPAKIKTLTKQILTDDSKEVCIMVASSQFGQPAITDSRMRSIFTSFFVKALAAVTDKKYKDDSYIAWPQILKKASDQAFKESRGYDIGGGVAGKQQAVFQAFVSNEVKLEDRFLNMVIKFEAEKK
jgi:hypothetical protein